ncbi:hypothetical protein F511_37922, partial [Dorcoceras hygrometricum]
QETELLGGIGSNAQHIRDELGQMRAFLRAADKREESDPQLKEWVEKVRRFTETYNLMDEGSGPKTNDTRGDALLLEGTDVVGIEEPKKQITEWLVQNDDGLKVISVVGMGGLGKTTMFKQIFDDALVKVSFDCHVWVLVSENFNLEKCLQNMISKLVNEVKLQPLQNLDQTDL